MILLTKSQDQPSSLNRTVVRNKVSTLKRLFTTYTDAYKRGDKKLDIQSITYYKAPDIKAQLIQDQHEKCCYCESKFSQTSFGAVEHFRPKASVQQDKDTTASHTGYFWLVCDWNNLYWACDRCNTEYKRFFFPLVDPSKRATSHHDALEDEEVLLVDPYKDDPTDFFRWHDEVIVPINEKGRCSITYYGLDRKALSNNRLERLKVLRRYLLFFRESMNLSQ